MGYFKKNIVWHWIIFIILPGIIKIIIKSLKVIYSFVIITLYKLSYIQLIGVKKDDRYSKELL
jgi:hypothetical protein